MQLSIVGLVFLDNGESLIKTSSLILIDKIRQTLDIVSLAMASGMFSVYRIIFRVRRGPVVFLSKMFWMVQGMLLTSVGFLGFQVPIHSNTIILRMRCLIFLENVPQMLLFKLMQDLSLLISYEKNSRFSQAISSVA